MRFSNRGAFERFIEQRDYAYKHGLIDNFNGVFARLMAWERYDEFGNMLNEVWIGTDFDKNSFTFSEHYNDGRRGVYGGIIFHGLPGKYNENGSVMLSPTCGWQIHT